MKNERGFTTIELLLVAFILGGLVFMANCTGKFALPYAPPQASLCAKPEAADSIICQLSTYLKTTPEQIDAMLLDASLVSLATKVTSAEELRKTLDTVEVWVSGRDILTMDGLAKYLGEKAAFDPYLALLLSRRLPILASVPTLSYKPLTAFDKSLVLLEIKRQKDQVAFF
jgi:hypothetical protein